MTQAELRFLTSVPNALNDIAKKLALISESLDDLNTNMKAVAESHRRQDASETPAIDTLAKHSGN